jgi:putative ABC transport system ATP-binding protein
LKKINEELGTTVAVITHNSAIAGMADRVIRLRSGEIVEIKANASKLDPDQLMW